VKRQLIALLGAIAVLLVLGSGAAQAQSVQGVEQVAGTGQSASSSASSTQTNPSNSNISVRIFSPGDNGSVSQSNNSVAGSVAGNAAKTDQGVSQSQGGGGGEQAVGQVAETIQKAKSQAESKQEKPSNSNISVRIHSPGDDGDVSQSNNSVAGSAAGNLAHTDQGVAQQQGGGEAAKKDDKCCHGGSGVQAVGQEAKTIQLADSEAKSVQEHARNENIPVRIGSKGDNGSVEQSNNSAALSFAGNLAKTSQGVEQAQGGGCGCHGGDAVQAVGQKAITGQLADSEATSIQKGASNSNTPVRIHSEGDDGDVEQSNNSLALSAALNAAKTEQAVGQSQGGGCGCGDRHKSDGAKVQAVGQWAETWQKADSDATSVQWKPSNTNAPVREKSKGGGGSVSQSNNSLAASAALNLAKTLQFVRQEQ
jgi:GTP cyclohydrolase II